MYSVFDAHCDTIFELEEQGLPLSENSLQLDLERMREYGTYIQVFAAFVDKTDIRMSPMNHCLRLIDRYYKEITKNADRILSIETAEDLKSAVHYGGAYSLLSLEGGEALEGNISALRMYYKMGVRLITLTWNHANEIADGITESRGGGLTEFGRQAVAVMEKLGILIDVSHLSERGFWDVVECTRYPFVASHSCAKALCGHIRNLTDEQIRAVIERNGCIGINFYPDFLSDSGECGTDMIVRHIMHILELGGEDSVGLGSDFDGVDCLPRGMNGVQDIGTLLDLLKTEGIPETILSKISFVNFYRVFYEALKRGELIGGRE